VFSPDLDAGCAERNVDRPDLVGPENGRPGVFEPRHHLAGRVPIVILRPDRDRRHAGTRRGHQLLGRGRAAPMMAGLEQVDGREAPGDQLGFDRRLGVPRQEEAPPLERAEEHD